MNVHYSERNLSKLAKSVESSQWKFEKTSLKLQGSN